VSLTLDALDIDPSPPVSGPAPGPSTEGAVASALAMGRMLVAEGLPVPMAFVASDATSAATVDDVAIAQWVTKLLASRRSPDGRRPVAEVAAICMATAARAEQCGCLLEIAEIVRQQLVAELRQAWHDVHLGELHMALKGRADQLQRELSGEPEPSAEQREQRLEEYAEQVLTQQRHNTPDQMKQITAGLRQKVASLSFAAVVKRTRARSQAVIRARIAILSLTRARQRRSTRTPLRTARPSGRKRKRHRSSSDPDPDLADSPAPPAEVAP
jgi:hypothetical protein